MLLSGATSHIEYVYFLMIRWKHPPNITIGLCDAFIVLNNGSYVFECFVFCVLIDGE